MALGPFALTAGRAIAADFATPLFSDPSLLMAGRGRPEVDPWSFLLPFSNSLWAVTFAALGIVVIVTSAVVVVGAWMSPKEMQRCWCRAALDLVFVYCGVLCQQSNATTTWICH